jgi:hypothetical protein
MLGSLTGGKGIDKAAKEARRLGIESKKFADTYGTQAQGLYDPYMQMGMDAWGNVQTQANNLLNSEVPEAYQFNTGGMQDLYNQYMNQAYVPEAVQAEIPLGPDYAGAADSALYAQLMENSQDAINNNAAANGLSARGSGAALDIARAANKNTMDVANQLYQNDINRYNMAQQNNQYRNQMLGQNLQQGMGLQQLMQQAGQQGYGNQVQSYGLQNQNLLNYLNQMNAIGGQGFNATNNMNSAYANVANSKIGTNSGMAKNAIEAAGAKAQANAALMGSIAGMAGSALGGGSLGAILGSVSPPPKT